MKKFTKAAAVVMMLALMTGCGSSGDATTAKPAATEGTTAAQAEKTTTGDTEAEKTTEGSEASDFYFQKGDVKIFMEAAAPDILSGLGEAKGTHEEKSCAFEGMDVTYMYPGFDLITAKKNGESVETVSQVVLRDDTVETAEGVFIGGSIADVEKAYSVTVGDANNVKVTKGNCDLLFIFKDGVISSIQYAVKSAE